MTGINLALLAAAKGQGSEWLVVAAAGFRCFECVLHTMEQECRKHPCQKPKGYYMYAN